MNLDDARRKFFPFEAKRTRSYFRQVFQLFPEKLRPSARKKFEAYDGLNIME